MSGQRHGRARFSPGKEPPVPIVQKAGWAPEPVWTQRLEEKSLSPLPEIEPRSPGRPARSQTLAEDTITVFFGETEEIKRLLKTAGL
jgi:hypothetical protein